MTRQTAVLYIEDDPSSRKVMQLLLVGRMRLQHVTILEDSADFLARATALNPAPDIIFLDIHVKPHDGFEMLDMLRQSPQFADKPIVALTASVMNEEVQQLRTAGFSGCLAKPIDADVFQELFEQLLDGEEIWRIA